MTNEKVITVYLNICFKTNYKHFTSLLSAQRLGGGIHGRMEISKVHFGIVGSSKSSSM